MGHSLIINDTSGMATIVGLHGGEGEIAWKRLVTGGMLYGDVESLEYSRVPPGVLIGLHEHTRTEEIWYVLAGKAEIQLNDEFREVGPHELITAPLGTRHSIRNVGTKELAFFVVEVVPPSLADRLPARAPSVEA